MLAVAKEEERGEEDVGIFDFSNDDEDDGAISDMNYLDTTIQVSPIPTTRIYKDHHPSSSDWRFCRSAIQTRNVTEFAGTMGYVSTIPTTRTNHKRPSQACFLLLIKRSNPKRFFTALKDPSRIDAMRRRATDNLMPYQNGCKKDEFSLWKDEEEEYVCSTTRSLKLQTFLIEYHKVELSHGNEDYIKLLAAWYITPCQHLSLDNSSKSRKPNKYLVLNRHKGVNILLVQSFYVDEYHL
ncbi:hypothetical protein Tco_1146510 [Tanacetum coccineum]